jgi:FAD:protein FMN transferase
VTRRGGLLALAMLGLAALVAWLAVERRQARIDRRTRFLMDTVCTVQVQGGEGERLAERALDRMEALDHKLNALDPTSPLHAFNHEGRPIDDPEILSVMRTALRVSAETGGAFDVTVFPLVEAWGFYGDAPRVPEPGALAESLARVGYLQLELTETALTRSGDRAAIDLGGIGKGYAIQAAVEVLRSAGARAALVDAGGDLYALGQPEGRLWRVGVRDPRGDGVIAIFGVADRAVVTSGDYERVFQQDGRRYHHILDPRTGLPARGLTSVTIVSRDAVLADALATAVFVLGRVEGLALVERLPDAEALLIDEEGAVHTTTGLSDVVTVERVGW